MQNITDLLTLEGLTDWLKTVNESYRNKTIAELAGLILSEVEDYKISENPQYNVFFKNFNVYIQTVKNENKFKLALFEYKNNTLKMIGIVEKEKQNKPSTFTNTKKTPYIEWKIKTSYVYGEEIIPGALKTAKVENCGFGNIIYNFSSLNDQTTPSVGAYDISVVFLPDDYVTYSNGRESRTLFVTKITPKITWELDNPKYINFDATFNSSSYMTATSNVEGEFEYNFDGLEDGTLTETKDYTVTVTFNPIDKDIYNTVTKSIIFKVRKFPELSVDSGSYTLDVDDSFDGKFTIPIGYYESGSNNESGSTTGRNATATYDSNSVAGTFIYYPKEGTVYEFSNFDPEDIQEQYEMQVTASFNPSDTGSYAPVSTVISDTIIINKEDEK